MAVLLYLFVLNWNCIPDTFWRITFQENFEHLLTHIFCKFWNFINCDSLSWYGGQYPCFHGSYQIGSQKKLAKNNVWTRTPRPTFHVSKRLGFRSARLLRALQLFLDSALFPTTSWKYLIRLVLTSHFLGCAVLIY